MSLDTHTFISQTVVPSQKNGFSLIAPSSMIISSSSKNSREKCKTTKKCVKASPSEWSLVDQYNLGTLFSWRRIFFSTACAGGYVIPCDAG
jgi:hypothetical protein